MTTQTTTAQDSALSSIRQRLESSMGDAVIRENVRRHYQTLERLAANLRALGMDDRDIGENVLQVFHSYERELVNYVNEVQGNRYERL